MIAALLLCSEVALAADAPEFLLGSLNVRVDVPGGYRMTKWSDWDFTAQSPDGVLVFVWATPFQVPITDAAPWAPVFEAKVTEMSGKDPKAGANRVGEVGGRKVAYVDVGFAYRDGNAGTMYGATIEIDGQNLHLATISPNKVSGAGKRARDELVGRLDFKTPPPVSTFGAEVKARGVTTTLPPDWRPSLDAEWQALVPSLARLGLEDVTDCWIAVRPVPTRAPDAMVTCSRPITLGVVDEHSFAAADEAVRAKFFGSIPAGAPVPLPDRTALLYTPKEGVAFGVVPDADGAAVTWALGEGDLGPAVRASMQASAYAGPHPVSTGETVSYWLTARTFSPQVLCPALGCLGVGGVIVVGGAAAAFGLTRRRSSEDEEV